MVEGGNGREKLVGEDDYPPHHRRVIRRYPVPGVWFSIRARTFKCDPGLVSGAVTWILEQSGNDLGGNIVREK